MVLSVLLHLLPPVLLSEVQGVLMGSWFWEACSLVNTSIVVYTIYNVKRIFQQESQFSLSMVIHTEKKCLPLWSTWCILFGLSVLISCKYVDFQCM